MLFSDGKANYGITDPNSLAKATRLLIVEGCTSKPVEYHIL